MKALALAVLREAFQDLVVPPSIAGIPNAQADAKLFFFSPERAETLSFWCQFADLDPEAVRRRAQHFVDHNLNISTEIQRVTAWHTAVELDNNEH